MKFQFHDDTQDDVPHSARNFHAKSKSVAMVITALTALVASAASLIKAMDTSLDEKSYETMANAIERVSQDTARNHDNIDSIYKYLEADREARKKAADAASAEIAYPTGPIAQGSKKKALKPQVPPVPSELPVLLNDPGPVKTPSFEEVKESASK